MAVMEVIHWPAQVLETPAQVVEDFNEDLKMLACDMHETMDAAGGIGLAANQVNVLKQIIVIYIPWQEPTRARKPWHKQSLERKQPWHDQRYTLVNPEIVKFQGEIQALEGCLSFPGNMDYVGRYREVTVSYQDVEGHRHSITCDGLMSVCLQHEIDHIRGVVFLERMDERMAEKIRQKMLVTS